MSNRIAIIGTGPTGIYALQQLLDVGVALSVTLFEKGDRAGLGMPYSPDTASTWMLANIASIEIPPVVTTYLEWLEDQPIRRLTAYGVAPDALDDRQFTPRLLLGEYFRDQLLSLVKTARRTGQEIKIQESTEVLDIISCGNGLLLQTSKEGLDGPFDYVVLATGHEFPDDDAASHSYFPSPWSGLMEAQIPAARVGIMGTSLSSLDAALIVANQHGRFRCEGDELAFDTAGSDLHITLMSRSGILPEADFYCPIPYEPLVVVTEAAVTACALSESPLDALFELIRAELMQADPAFALRIGLGGLDADTFAPAYFAQRATADPFDWARMNLEEVENNKANRVTVPWRYVLLRMHEKVEDIVSHLSDADRNRFDAGLKKVFVDNYAAVPSESIRRLLALRDAGILSILSLGENYVLTRQAPRTVIETVNDMQVFDVLIDARGQQPLTTKDLPFPALRNALIQAGQEIPDLATDYSLRGVEGFGGRVFLGSIPYLMHDQPFVQGITACADIAAVIARGVATARRGCLLSYVSHTA